MAQHALGKEGMIPAHYAQKGESYWCLECKARLKLRAGTKIRPHFYHFRAAPTCRLYSKSEDHLLLQRQLQTLFPPGELEIEKPFLSIGRVADLYWSREQIAFEIQCSLLSLEEAQLRMAHYQKIDCTVIWLLDDRKFNRRLVSPVESWIRERGAYYFSFRRFLFYDQFEIANGTARLEKGKPLPIDLRFPRKLSPIPWPKELPTCMAARLQKASYIFRGDLLDRAMRSPPIVSRWYALEQPRKVGPFFRAKKFLYLCLEKLVKI